MKPSRLVLAISSLAFLACDHSTDAATPKSGNGVEYVGRAPDGTMTPVFKSDAELKAYIDRNPKKFPDGTVLLKR